MVLPGPPLVDKSPMPLIATLVPQRMVSLLTKSAPPPDKIIAGVESPEPFSQGKPRGVSSLSASERCTSEGSPHSSAEENLLLTPRRLNVQPFAAEKGKVGYQAMNQSFEVEGPPYNQDQTMQEGLPNAANYSWNKENPCQGCKRGNSDQMLGFVSMIISKQFSGAETARNFMRNTGIQKSGTSVLCTDPDTNLTIDFEEPNFTIRSSTCTYVARRSDSGQSTIRCSNCDAQRPAVMRLLETIKGRSTSTYALRMHPNTNI
eukprot:CAMPEP_0119021250 /NCGR_PEP_ID=MMETSP1176-20130426/25624_1 /TAXON_ID=265551 /ORGANISM="Synedropsis recta cf, Strain CCMP1620" /LENGTH=260 /DNA_ID=CAMNT_0006975817 /DNA_START=115 /DNA_END=894 /DNA_ORIENTATION=-